MACEALGCIMKSGSGWSRLTLVARMSELVPDSRHTDTLAGVIEDAASDTLVVVVVILIHGTGHGDALLVLV